MLKRFTRKGQAKGAVPRFPSRSKGRWLAVYLASFLFAGVGLAGPFLYDLNKTVNSYKRKRVLVRVVRHPKQEHLVQEVEKRPTQPKQAPKKVFDASKLREKRPRRRRHRRVKRKKRVMAPRKEAFGLTQASVTKGGAAVAARVVDTLMKEPEKVYVPPKAPSVLPRQGPYDVGDVERPPRFVYRAVPEYPEEAEEDGVEGVVLVWLIVDEKGRPLRVERVKGPSEDLELAAKRAAMRSRFLPAIHGSKPVMCRVKIPYRFRLE